MKKLIIVLMLLIPCTVSAKTFKMTDHVQVETKVVCESGKKFLIVIAANKAKANTANPEIQMDVKQIYRQWNNFGNPPVPEECDRKSW